MIKAFLRVIIVLGILVGCFATGYMANSFGVFNSIFGSGRVNINVVTVLEKIQAMSQLTTTRYSFSNIVTSEREMPPLLAALYGERMVMVAVGYVDAGIDLSQLASDSIQFVDNEVIVRLPAPTLQDCFFNEGDSYVVSRDTGLFARPLPNLDTDSRKLAISKFREEAFQQGILTEAQKNAEVALGEFVTALFPQGTRVRITTAPANPEAPLPDTCE